MQPQFRGLVVWCGGAVDATGGQGVLDWLLLMLLSPTGGQWCRHRNLGDTLLIRLLCLCLLELLLALPRLQINQVSSLL